MQSGFLLINKPSGPTSHNIISRLRKITGVKRIGHSGTLDPFASGLLIVALGREYTKKLSNYLKMDKEYVATLRLGAETDTYDREGVVQENMIAKKPENKIVEEVLNSFVGKQKQVPPMYSAKKIQGKKLYELARKGVEIERAAVEIEIYEIALESFDFPILKIRVRCSSGTYIRSIAHDLGQKIGCGAYLEELERTQIGEIGKKRSYFIDEVKNDNWENLLVDEI